MSARTLRRAGLLLLVLAGLGLHAAAIFSTAFNWDEFAILNRAARSLSEGVLRSSGHAGLAEVVLAPLVSACGDEIAVGHRARLLWLLFTLGYLAGLAALLLELLRGRPHRTHDAALGCALLGLLPVFLEWSLQVRSDQLALVGASWGGVALLASRRRPALAALAGLGLGVGALASQKAYYAAALMGLLAIGQLVALRDWQPRREALRALVALAALGGVIFAYQQLVALRFALPAQHHMAALAEAPQLQRELDVFAFYRGTIGYSQYIDMLPSLAPHAVLLCLLGLAGVRALRQREDRVWVALAWAVLALGAAVAAFHAAAFAYFWLTLGLFPAVALAIALAPARKLLPPHWLRPGAVALWVALLLPAGFQTAALLHDTQAVQRESLGFVQRNFAPGQAGFQPESALFCGRAQPFGTWMSFTIYEQFGGKQHAGNTRQWLQRFREAPLYYLVQSFRLNQFPVELRRFWAENYQPYRASVFVAGRRLAGQPGEMRSFEIVAAGPYRWLPRSGPQPLAIDGTRIAAGDVITLAAGTHRAEFPERVPGGVLVLALDEPPGLAPLAFYKTY
jgi:hypothetical protein